MTTLTVEDINAALTLACMRRDEPNFENINWHCRMQKWESKVIFKVDGELISASLGYYDDPFKAYNSRSEVITLINKCKARIGKKRCKRVILKWLIPSKSKKLKTCSSKEEETSKNFIK